MRRLFTCLLLGLTFALLLACAARVPPPQAPPQAPPSVDDGTPPAPGAGPAPEVVGDVQPVKLPRTLNLIPLIDPQRDAVRGKWVILGNVLQCQDQHLVPRIQVPYIPPAEYDFSVTFSQPKLRHGISLIMPNPNGGAFHWYLDAGNGSEYGFCAIPKNVGADIPNLILSNTVYRTTVQVRRDGVKGYLGTTLLIQHRTDFRDLTTDNWRKMNDTRVLAVACDDPTTFHKVEITEINAVGRRAD